MLQNAKSVRQGNRGFRKTERRAARPEIEREVGRYPEMGGLQLAILGSASLHFLREEVEMVQ